MTNLSVTPLFFLNICISSPCVYIYEFNLNSNNNFPITPVYLEQTNHFIHSFIHSCISRLKFIGKYFFYLVNFKYHIYLCVCVCYVCISRDKFKSDNGVNSWMRISLALFWKKIFSTTKPNRVELNWTEPNQKKTYQATNVFFYLSSS